MKGFGSGRLRLGAACPTSARAVHAAGLEVVYKHAQSDCSPLPRICLHVGAHPLAATTYVVHLPNTLAPPSLRCLLSATLVRR